MTPKKNRKKKEEGRVGDRLLNMIQNYINDRRELSRNQLHILEKMILSLPQEIIFQSLPNTDFFVERTAPLLAHLAWHCADKNQVGKGAGLIAWAMALLPTNPVLLVTAGQIQARVGNLQFAVDCFKTALDQNPNNASALSNLSDLLVNANQWSAAEPFLKRLNHLYPQNTVVLRTLGISQMKMSKIDEACKIFQHLSKMQPESVEHHANLGLCLRMLRRYKEAETVLVNKLSQANDYPEIHHALAWLYSDMLDETKSLYHGYQSIILQPRNINFLYCYGYLLRRYNHRSEAKEIFRKALAVDPNDAMARFGYAELMLYEGEIQTGLVYYESRFDIMQSWLSGPWPVWDGKKAAGKIIFVEHEQGIGDTIQFCRYLPLLYREGARIIFSCQPSLASMIERIGCIDNICQADDLEYSSIKADVQISLLSLMGVFGTTLETIPCDCPYLTVDSQLVVKFKQLLPNTNKYKVGLVWAGNPKQADDCNRSLQLRQLVSLGKLKNVVQFFSFQVGYAASQVDKYGSVLDLIDLSPFITTFDDTAALMKHMDLVVSVCTSTLHLAGALGLPSVALLHSSPDWRWLVGRIDSPWYPTMRLIRQSTPGQWEPVVRELIDFIHEQIDSDNNISKVEKNNC